MSKLPGATTATVRAVAAARVRSGPSGSDLGVALVQTHDRVAKLVDGEELDIEEAPARVRFGQRDLVDLGDSELREVGFSEPVDRGDVSFESQRVAERRERLPPILQAASLHRGAPRREHLTPAVRGTARMVEDAQRFGEVLGERFAVARRQDRCEALAAAGRGVRAHAAMNGSPRLATRDLVEARERLCFAVVVEVLESRRATVARERPELEEGPLVAAAAVACDPRRRPAHQERIGSQRQHLVEAADDPLRGFEHHAHARAQVLALQRRKSQPAVIDELGRRRHQPGPGVEFGRLRKSRDRIGRRCGAYALRALGKRFGVALVQTHDRVTEAVGGEDLGRD